jgi:hypothetical protein
MRQLYLLLLFTGILTGNCFAQVSINADGSQADPSAILDIKSSSKGFLAPRVALTATTDVTTIINPAAGLLIYNTATAGNSPNNVTPGYYYYNGTVWAALAVSIGSGFFHYIGELYAGGIVVAVWKAGNVEHGLIASLVDMKTSGDEYLMAWSGNTTQLIGAPSQSPIDGQANTTAIIGQDATADKAATVCDAYTITDGTGTYSDWYLPSIWELNQCYNADFIVNTILGAANGFQFTSLGYWSSTEASSNYAWYHYFDAGYSNNWGKGSMNRVRAVRRF